MKGLIQIAAALWLAFAALALAAAPGADLTVFAAASLADALRRIGEDFEERGGAKVAFNFAASSTLARQIAEGAPADLFFSADEAQMNSLERNGLLLPGTRTNRLGNSLVIVVPADSSLIFTSATNLAESAVR